MNEIEAFIRERAGYYGINPDVAVRLARAEGGLHDPFRQAEAMLDYGREESYGPFQLHMRSGMGADALKAGIDPRTDWKGGVDYALYRASQGGWSPWMAAPKIGLSNWEGITQNARAQAPTGYERKPYAAGGAAVVPEGTGPYAPARGVGGAGVVPAGTPGLGSDVPPDIAHPPNPTVGSDGPVSPFVLPAKERPKHWLEVFAQGAGEAAKAMGSVRANRPSYGQPQAALAPAEQPVAPVAAVGGINPERRMQLAAIMQQLNSGRLF